MTDSIHRGSRRPDLGNTGSTMLGSSRKMKGNQEYKVDPDVQFNDMSKTIARQLEDMKNGTLNRQVNQN